MNNLWQSFLIALQFLTIIPIQLSEPVKAENQGYSLIFYPFIGLIIASTILICITILSGQSIWVNAVLTLSLWIFLSGALHLDGLADSADAWLAGLGDKNKTLSVMKDPTSGPIAITVLLMALFIKLIMLAELIQHQDYLSIIMTLVLSRMAVVMLLLTTPYIRKNGIGSVLVNNLPQRPLRLMLGVISLLAVILVDLIPLALLLIIFLLLRYYMIKRLDGTTGDTAGALLELLEVSSLTLFVLF
jgi:adenosylcobinamide-GDP ribazoletransferase